ncbi:MAG TPA: MmcQ/YjbR family DNA-binding protein [Acidobacteriaceae bacterium]|jgi:hypothetical protein|nr:MmcQ/YjbR family DNA-binding protein [Acidobacteriaceae bacterium]
MTAAEFRKIALSLPGAEEKAHMNHPDFRAGGKIFATLAYPDARRGMVKLFPDQQEAFVTRDPEMFQPVKGGWGKQGCTQVILKTATAGRVREAMKAAWERVSVKAGAERSNRATSVPKKRRLKPAV